MKDIGWKIFSFGLICLVIAIIALLVMGGRRVILKDNFCDDKGYTFYHTNTDEGYIACCKYLTENHIKTDKKVCKAFEYNRN